MKTAKDLKVFLDKLEASGIKLEDLEVSFVPDDDVGIDYDVGFDMAVKENYRQGSFKTVPDVFLEFELHTT
jgi:hypothetical protein